MKKYLYFVVPLAKWVANTLVVIVIFSFVFPVPIAPWVDLIIGWTISAFIAAPFAYWAFKEKIPTDKELGVFIFTWVLVTVVMEMVIALIYSTPLNLVVIRYEFLVQTLLEVATILIMARVMRRHNAYHMAAPGIDLDGNMT